MFNGLITDFGKINFMENERIVLIGTKLAVG